MDWWSCNKGIYKVSSIASHGLTSVKWCSNDNNTSNNDMQWKTNRLRIEVRKHLSIVISFLFLLLKISRLHSTALYAPVTPQQNMFSNWASSTPSLSLNCNHSANSCNNLHTEQSVLTCKLSSADKETSAILNLLQSRFLWMVQWPNDNIKFSWQIMSSNKFRIRKSVQCLTTMPIKKVPICQQQWKITD